MTPARVLAFAVGLAVGPALVAEDRFVAPLPAPSEFQVRRDLVYAEQAGAPLAFDLYVPASRSGAVPVVVFLNGIGASWMRGHVQYTGWASAVTARGLAGITMDSREDAVEADVGALLAYLESHAAELGVDPGRVALWACSANVRRGLPLAQSLGGLRSAVLFYGSGETASFRRDRPLLFVRAGLDNPGLNRAIDALVARALADNAPVELINLAGGVHGFDIRDDDETARAAISRTLDFLKATLTGALPDAITAAEPRAAAASAVYGERWAEAAAAYQRLAAADAGDAVVWQRLGEARRELGDRRGALTAFERALALETPNRGIVSFAVASLHAEAGEPERALAALRAMKPWLRFFVDEIRTRPEFAGLRADPRLVELLADVAPPPR